MAEIADILKLCVQYGASDILLVPGEPPVARVAGSLAKLPNMGPSTAAEVRRWIYSLIDERQRAVFEKELDLDAALELPGVGRFRLNVFLQNRGIAAALRTISISIPTADEISLSPTVRALADLPRGLVLVTGPTGSGKSSTLACLVELINQRHAKHIITIEDPIEFVYQNKKSIIDQRAVGTHTASFGTALKYALRQNPDVILIGELRDQETTALALSAAESGHLCLATVHTNDAPQTINRVVDEFPHELHDKVRHQLGGVLRAVVSQTLVPRGDGQGRVCAREVMLMTTGIAAQIRDGKIHEIYGSIESGGSQGMISLDQSLVELLKSATITIDDALARCRDAENLRRLYKMSGGGQPDQAVLSDPLALARFNEINAKLAVPSR